MYYFNARWYDAELGRFVTEDPARDGSNWYEYCGNNPLANIDFNGLAPVKPNAKSGQQAHTFFEDSLTTILVGEQAAKDKTAYSDRPLNRIINSIFNLFGVETRSQKVLIGQDPAIDELSSPSRRPDLTVVNNTTKKVSVYELKPDSCKTGYKNKRANRQISTYISELSKNSSGFTVEGGKDIPSGLTLPYTNVGKNGTITFTADLKISGLYFYTIDDGVSK